MGVARSGVLVVDKPRGPTSHDVVMRIRRALGTRDVGHAGTLDPMATGVLVLALGEGTKLVQWLTAHDKTYEATIALGLETDTLDSEGRPVRNEPPSDAVRAALDASNGAVIAPLLKAAIDVERTRTEQLPPAFSAIRHAGERSYTRARRGEATDLRARPVIVHRLDVVRCSADPALVSVTIDVAKGYYVRALARDLAATLGTVGHLTSLRRTRSGCFLGDEAVGIDAGQHEMIARVQPIALVAARALPVARLTDAGERAARHGQAIAACEIESTGTGACAWLNATGDLVAVGAVDATGRGAVLRGFAASTAG